MIFPLIFGRVACHTKRMLLKTTAHLLSFFIRAYQLHTAEHTYTRTYIHTSGIYSISGTRPISKDKVSFFLLFFILFTYHFSSQFRLYSHRMILSLSCILKQKSHNSFIVSSLLLSCYIFLLLWCSVRFLGFCVS